MTLEGPRKEGDKISPEEFWNRYLQELRQCSNWSDYMDNKLWTDFTIKAATKVCEDLRLETDREYYRLDLLGYSKKVPAEFHNWTARVAYEHENGTNWQSEFCKLAHIIADLRVLIFYHDYKNDGTAHQAIEKHLNKIKDRALRFHPQMAWLFICGPRKISGRSPFRAYSINKDKEVVELEPPGAHLYPDIW